MSFNSFEFALFLPVVFILYWFVLNKNLKWQNLFLLLASYFFYGWWDWRFLSLIIISSITDYLVGLKLGKTTGKKKRKKLLFCSIGVNLLLLGFFKYFNFFHQSLISAFSGIGIQLHESTLKIILPVGISFYTFQTLSYTIDIYREKIKPTKDIIGFFAFVSFFPQLVSGPIERAKNLLPQFEKTRVFDYEKAKDGLRFILWGFFKKMVIADTCAVYVDEIFKNYNSFNGSILFIGVILFAFQIYGDFSGYSDIAIGTARLLGFDLMTNFALPYFSRDMKEFWKRWHISLSTWFRDYVYIPLGGNRCSQSRRIGNVMITFTVSGLWHGANWTFITWGFLHGLLYIPAIIRGKRDKQKQQGSKEIFQVGTTFFLVLITWVFFRAENLYQALFYLETMFFRGLFLSPGKYWQPLVWILILVVAEWLQRKKKHTLDIAHLPTAARWVIYQLIILIIIFFGRFGYHEFIYFQF